MSLKATAVDTNTTGLMAGEAKRKVSAAAVGILRRMSDWATGTEAHSHPGSKNPAPAAAGTAKKGLSGVMWRRNESGTKAEMAPETITPNTRNGTACMTIATVIEAHASTVPFSESTGPRTIARRSKAMTAASIANVKDHPIARSGASWARPPWV